MIIHALKTIKRAIQVAIYKFNNQRPWSIGYGTFRLRYLDRVLNDSSILDRFETGAELPKGYAWRLDARLVELPWVLSRLRQKSGLILDAGASLNHLPVVNAPAMKNKKLTIITLAPEPNCFWKNDISYVFGDLRKMYFDNESFESIACISTIEHVGMDNSFYAGEGDRSKKGGNEEFADAIREFYRLLKPGGTLYISFPYGIYKDHGWFQQFDSTLTNKLINAFNPTQSKLTYFRYSPEGWKISSKEECDSCEFFDVRKSKYFDKSSKIEYPSDFPAGERAVLCIEMIKGDS